MMLGRSIGLTCNMDDHASMVATIEPQLLRNRCPFPKERMSQEQVQARVRSQQRDFQGEALVLYLLSSGAIEFTGS
jgi:hypothetical protein